MQSLHSAENAYEKLPYKSKLLLLDLIVELVCVRIGKSIFFGKIALARHLANERWYYHRPKYVDNENDVVGCT